MAVTLVRALFAIVLAVSPLAHADEPSPLGQAKLLIEQVRYDEAQRLLITALEGGGNQPPAMREIYKLLAASAVALGRPDDAEKYYRAWISLEPKAALEAGASPKLREPFDAAKSYITANGPLDVAAELVADSEVRLHVISDPLALARSARLRDEGEAAPIVDRGAVVGGQGSVVLVIDRHGNTLVELPVRGSPQPPPATDYAPTYSRDVVEPVVMPKRSTTFYALAIPTGLALATAVGFGAASIVYNRQVQNALDDSGGHYYSDVVGDQKRVTQFWKLSAIIGGAGLVLAIPTALLYMRDRDTMVMPFADGHGAGAAIAGRF